MARAVVTGAGGGLGKHLVALLLADGFDVETWESRLDVDVRDEAAVREAVARARPDVVFHLAGTRDGTDDELEAANVTGFAHLAAALAETAPNARVIVAGSSAQYGLRSEPRPLAEDEPQQPEGAYGKTKAAQEALALAGGLDVVCARLFNLVGALQRPGVLPADLTAQLIDPAADRLVVRHLVGTRDFVDYWDAARALAILAQRGVTRTTYNVATGRATVLRDLAGTLLELSGRALPIDDRGEVPPDAERVHQVGDPARLQELGWNPEVSLRDSLAAQLAAAV